MAASSDIRQCILGIIPNKVRHNVNYSKSTDIICLMRNRQQISPLTISTPLVQFCFDYISNLTIYSSIFFIVNIINAIIYYLNHSAYNVCDSY